MIVLFLLLWDRECPMFIAWMNKTYWRNWSKLARWPTIICRSSNYKSYVESLRNHLWVQRRKSSLDWHENELRNNKKCYCFSQMNSNTKITFCLR
jgi:hypothetical protein